jgi:hypothetical protein
MDGPITTGSDARKPLFIVISTAGVATKRRAVPLSIYLPYYDLLSVPYKDRVRMEDLVRGDKGAHVRDFVAIQPPFLTDGVAKSFENIRVEWEWGDERIENDSEPGLQLRYTNSRRDVGACVFEKAIVDG